MMKKTPAIALLIAGSVALNDAAAESDSYFERELALSAIEHVKQRAWNQDFLHGFELDRSADTALFIENMPINQPMNGQGQGYKNTSFIIPELVSSTLYKRGPFYAEEGDFSSGGSIRMNYANALEVDTLILGVGENAYQRGVLLGSADVAKGNLVYGLETVGQDVNPDLSNSSSANGHRNAAFKYYQGDTLNGFNVTTLLHQSDWKTDGIKTAMAQTPEQQFLQANAADDSSRYSVSASWWQSTSTHRDRVNAYVIDYDANLDVAFRFYTRAGRIATRTVARNDKRVIMGVNADHDWFHSLGGFHRLGAALRHDEVSDIASNDITTEQRDNGDALLDAAALYYRHQYQWSDTVRSIAGLRWDHLKLAAAPSLDTDFSRDSDHQLSPKLSVIIGPWKSTEYFLNVGRGIHSNDPRYSFRGINSTAADRDHVDRVPPLAKTQGADIGFSTKTFDNAVISISLWYLDAESELEASANGSQLRPSRRKGLEMGVYYQPGPSLSIDLNAVMANARFSDNQPQGNFIPGSIEDSARLGITYLSSPWAMNLSAHYYGKSPYAEDNSMSTKAVARVDLTVQYQYTPNLSLRLELLNLLDESDKDESVLFDDRLAAAEAFVEDFYYQPVPPRTAKLQFSYSWHPKN